MRPELANIAPLTFLLVAYLGIYEARRQKEQDRFTYWLLLISSFAVAAGSLWSIFKSQFL